MSSSTNIPDWVTQHPNYKRRNQQESSVEAGKGSNRFMLSDYVYDREDDSGPSAPIDYFSIDSRQRIPVDTDDGMTYLPSSIHLHDKMRKKTGQEMLREMFPAPAPLPRSEVISTAIEPGPQISPSDNTAIKRLPPIPTSTPGLPSTPSPSFPQPTLSHSLSTSSLASSHPSPLLPPFQLNPTKINGLRPSLVTMQSGGSTVGIKMHHLEGTELAVLPSLPSMTFAEDRDRNVKFAGEEEEAVMEKGEPGRRSSRRWLQWIWPDSLFCRMLLGTVVTELVIDLANILWRFNTEVKSSESTQLMLENKRRLPIFLIIFGLAHLWQLLLTIIAIRTKNTIQISAITIFNFAFLAWAVIQVSELRTILGDLQTSLDAAPTSTNLLNLPLNILTAVIIGVVATCSLVLSVLAYFVRREFGYRFLGADLQIRGYYRRFQIFECLVFFALFFSAGFGIQFIWLVLQKTDAEYIITWVVFPLSLIVLIIGRTAAKYENKPFMIFFCSGLFLGEAYFIFKLIRIWQQASTTYLNVTKSLTVFAALSILTILACFIWSVLVYRDFGKGLKGAVMSQHPKSPRVGFNRWRSTGDEEAGGMREATMKRISID